MSEEIDNHVLRKYEIVQRLGRYVIPVIPICIMTVIVGRTGLSGKQLLVRTIKQ